MVYFLLVDWKVIAASKQERLCRSCEECQCNLRQRGLRQMRTEQDFTVRDYACVFVSILLTVSRMFIGQAAACASLSTGRYSSGPRLYLPVWACEVQRTSESACPWTRFFNNSSTCYSVKADDTATIRNSSWLRYHPPLRSKSSAVCDETGFISFESASSLPRGARVELIAEDSDPCHTELQQYHLVSAILLPSNAQVIMKVSMML